MGTDLIAVVEIPKGSSNKYEWDDELGAIKLDRLLFSSLGYPTDYGFFRNTLAADGDPLDAMIVVSEPTFPGCLIEVKPVALFRMRDEKAEDNKILCVPLSDPNWSHIERLDDARRRSSRSNARKSGSPSDSRNGDPAFRARNRFREKSSEAVASLAPRAPVTSGERRRRSCSTSGRRP